MADPKRLEQFNRTLAVHERPLRSYVFMLVPQSADVDEIMQEIMLVLWEKLEQLDPESNIFAWACQVARFKVQHYRRDKQRDRVIFSDALIEHLADEAGDVAGELDECQVALESCLQKLNPQHRNLLRLRYDEELPVNQIALSAGRSAEAIYKALARSRQFLHECVKRSMAPGKV